MDGYEVGTDMTPQEFVDIAEREEQDQYDKQMRASKAIEDQHFRYRSGQLLKLLSRNEKLGSSTNLDEWETGFMATILRDYLDYT
jgi:hypothetical protein